MLDLHQFNQKITTSLFKGSLPDWQKIPVHALIYEGLDRKRRLEEIAHVLAQCYHETARFKFTHEIGRGAGHLYGNPTLLIRGKTETYYGRGWIQTTWLRNYAIASIKASLRFNEVLDFVNNPDLIIEREDVQAWYVWEGFIGGMWTGKNLADYWDNDTFNHVAARAIVNGDVVRNGPLIGDYAQKFLKALFLIPHEKLHNNTIVDVCPLENCPMKDEGDK